MRIFLACLSAFLTLGVAAEEELPMPEDLIFRDPRLTRLSLGIRKGEELEKPVHVSSSLLIICWWPAPNGESDVYQISGIDGYHSKARVVGFLERFYELLAPERGESTHVIMAGNNWAASRHLRDELKALSKAYGFDVFFTPDRLFKQVQLQPEPADRLEDIRKAFAESAPEVKSPEGKGD